MAITLEEISTITAKGQTTIPKAVRQALGVGYGGRIAFRVSDAGVTVCRADIDEDPAIDSFLSFLAALIAGLALSAPAMAAGSIFVVRGVAVEATGESGPKACEAAYGQGQDQAVPDGRRVPPAQQPRGAQAHQEQAGRAAPPARDGPEQPGDPGEARRVWVQEPGPGDTRAAADAHHAVALTALRGGIAGDADHIAQCAGFKLCLANGGIGHTTLGHVGCSAIHASNGQ